MSTWLLRQDAAVRALPHWMTVSSAVALTALGLVTNLSLFTRTKYGEALPDLVVVAALTLVMWACAAAFLWTPAFRQRGGDLVMTLPFTVKHLWLTHSVAVVLVGLVATVSMTAISMGIAWLVARITGQLPQLGWAALLKLGAGVFVTFALATTVLQSRAVHLSDVPRNARFVRMAMAVLVLGWALTTWLATLHAALLLVPAIATALLGARTLSRLPTTFASVPLPQAAPATRSEPAPTTDGERFDASTQEPSDWMVHASGRYGAFHMAALFLLSLHRAAPKAIATAVFAVPGLLFFGFLLSGAFDAIDDDGSAAFRWISIPLTVYMLLAIFAKPLKSLTLLDALPVSRRVLFALMIVPSLIVMEVGYGTGLWIAARFTPQSDVDFHVVSSSCSGVTVPRSMLRISWDGELPRIDTPWGASHEPWNVPIYRGSRAVVWSPYCARDTSTAPGFAALQASRASADLYGTAVAQEDIQRLLDAEPEQSGLPLRQEYPDLSIQARYASFPLMALFVCGSWFLTVALCLRAYRSGFSDRARKWTTGGLLGFLMLLHIAQFVPFFLDLTEPWILEAFWEGQMRSLALSIPGSSVTLSIVAAAFGLLLYRVAERQFERAEFLGGPGC